MAGPVLLTGASGLLGGWLHRTRPLSASASASGALVALSHRREVAAVATATADLRDRAQTLAAVASLAPALIVHTAYAIDEASIVDATANVVAAAGAVGADVLLTSTDAVFSGDGVARDESDVPDPVLDYGRWKAAAEAAVLGASATSTVVRLPLLVSIEPDDHVVRQIRASLAAGEPSRWFDDEIRRPAMAEDIARALWRLIELPAGERAGCWHLAGPERLSRFEVAQRVVARLGGPPGAVAGEPTPMDLVRPRDLELRDQRARAAIGWDPAPVLR